jgi:uncharacterized protein
MISIGIRRATRATVAIAAALAAAAATVALPAGSLAAAASFDCSRSLAADEEAICRTETLSNADVRMVTLYETVLKLVPMGVRSDLEEQQHEFARARTVCGAEVSCIAGLYQQRIAGLEKIIDDIAARGPY